MSEQVDVIVIGMGPGGEDVGGKLAEAGLEVVGIEASLVGGECPYWGCIPSKMMIRAANLLAEGRRIPGIAGTSTVEPDWEPVATRIKEQATDDWDDTVAVDRFVGKGGRFVRGRGALVGPKRVQVGDTIYEARKGVVLATGTTAAVPPIEGLNTVEYWTNHEIIKTKEVPASLVVLGAGAIGAELTQVMARFGAKVTIVEAADRLVPLEEPEAGELLAEVFRAEGIDVRVGLMANHVAQDGPEIAVTLSDGSVVKGERLLVATGRRTNLADLGLDTVGIDPGSRFLDADEHMVLQNGLWAVGDIVGQGAFTHVALYQSAIAVANILGEDNPGADYRALSRVTFSDPEIGSVGITEAQAREQGLPVAVALQNVAHTARGWLHGTGNEGLIKLVVDTDADIVVGATSAGPHGGEVLGLLSLAVHAKISTAQMRQMIFAYPTFHKGIEDALRQL